MHLAYGSNRHPFRRAEHVPFQLPGDARHLPVGEKGVLLDSTRAIGCLETIAKLGVIISMNDYRARDRQLALSCNVARNVIIDRDLISDSVANDNSAVLVQIIIEMAHDLDLTVMARGIDDETTFENLKTLGCDYGMDYDLAPPLAHREAVEWLLHQANGNGHPQNG